MSNGEEMPPIPDDQQKPREVDSSDVENNIQVIASDSDDDLNENLGYALLPQEPEDECGEGDTSTQNNSSWVADFSTQSVGNCTNNVGNNTMNDAAVQTGSEEVDTAIRGLLEQDTNEALSVAAGPSIFDHNQPTPESLATVELWNKKPLGEITLKAGTETETGGLELDAVKCEKITKAMSSIKLPLDNQPEWAKHINDDQWKAELTNRLKNVKK